MTSSNAKYASPAVRYRRGATRAAAAALAAMALAGCRHGHDGSEVAGWTLVDPSERHPIIVSQQPASLSVQVAAGSRGLSATQRGDVLDFARRYRASDFGNSRLVISAPTGVPNDVASMQAVRQIRNLLTESGYPETAILIEAYVAESSRAPVRVSFLRYVAEPPVCGDWSTNLARERENLPYPNFGCATQRNLAVMVANPADLLGPRGETARSSERRDVTWRKYTEGQSTVSEKASDEKMTVKGEN